jgi:hypothetical protein
MIHLPSLKSKVGEKKVRGHLQSDADQVSSTEITNKGGS